MQEEQKYKGTNNKTNSQRAYHPRSEFSFRGILVLWCEIEEGVRRGGVEVGSRVGGSPPVTSAGRFLWSGAWTRASLGSAGRALPGWSITGSIKRCTQWFVMWPGEEMGRVLGCCKGVCWRPGREAELLGAGHTLGPVETSGRWVGSPQPPPAGRVFSLNYPVTERSVYLGL